MFKLRNILENKLFKTFVLFSVFRAIYGVLVLFISYFLSTTYDDGILFTILFLVISFIFSRYMFKKLKMWTLDFHTYTSSLLK